MKKIMIVIISLLVVLSLVVFGDDVLKLFDLSLLGDEAVENSLSLDAAALTLDSKKLDQNEAEKNAINANQPGGDRVTYINNMIKVHSDTLLADMSVKLSEMALEKQAVDLKNELYIKGMNYLLLLEEIQLNEQLLLNENVYLNVVEKKVSRGVLTSTDLTNQKIVVQSQEMKIVELNAALNALKIEINHLIGEPLDSELLIEDDLTPMLYVTFDVQKLYDERSVMYPDIYEKTILLESKTIIFDLYADKYLESNKEYKTALYDKQMAEINLSDAKKNYEVSLRTSYNNYLNAYNSYQLTLKQLDLQMKLYTDMTKKYDLGLTTDEDVLKSKAEMLKSEFAVHKAIVDYNTARILFVNLY